MALTNHILPDSPTNNFCTLNPLAQFGSPSISEGNLEISLQATSADGCFASMLPVTQKYYWETLLFSGIQGYGLMENTSNAYNDHHTVYYTDGRIYVNGSLITNGATTATSGDVIGVAFDPVAQTIQFFKNTSLIGSYSTTGNGLLPSVVGTGNGAGVTVVNFGQDPTFAGNKNTPATVNINGTNVTGPFAPSGTAAGTAGLFYYPPPAGAKALCTANLPDFTPTVTDDTPQEYFKAVTYQASGVDDQIQNVNVGFQPDLIWIKNRDNIETHYLTDTIRSSLTNDRLDKFLRSNETSTEETVSNGVSETTITSKSYGFDISDSDTTSGELYFGTRKYVAWCFRAGGPPDLTSSPTKPFAKNGVQYETLSAANITAGTITPTAMSVNTDAGFSIVKYNGNSGGGDVPHGLSQKPDMLIVRPLTTTSDWIVWHKDIEQLSFNYLYLSQTIGGGFVSNYWGSTGVTNTKFGLYAGHTSAGNNNTNAGTSPYPHIAYCWHSVAGYSKCSSYTGNGSTDGPFVYCGFRPAFVICKCSSDTTTTHTSWAMYDNARDSINVMNKVLYANKSIKEGYRGDASTAATDIYIDFLSNGFKVRSTKEEVNDSGETYIFMAFAEQPFKFSNAR